VEHLVNRGRGRWPHWRRNGVALAALVLLVPTTWLTITTNESESFSSPLGDDPVTAEVGASVTMNGIEVGPGTARFVEEDAAPPGSRVVIVELPVDPNGDEVRCMSPRLREADGRGREWVESSYELGYGLFGDRVTGCPVEGTAPFTLVLSYLVAADATGPFHVDMTWSEALPRFARVTVAP